MEADALAHLLEREPEKFRTALDRSCEIAALARRSSLISFSEFARSITRQLEIPFGAPFTEILTPPFGSLIDEPFTVWDGNGRPVISVPELSGTISSRTAFYHELGHALLHSSEYQDGCVLTGARNALEAEAWLFAANCVMTDGRDSPYVVLNSLRDSVDHFNVADRPGVSAAFQFFSENWVDLSQFSLFEEAGRVVVVNLEQRLIEQIALDPSLLHSFEPGRFEEVIAEILSGIGYQVEKTKKTRDGGVDILAIAALHGSPLRFLIECKRYAPHRKVDVALVRSLYGVKTHVGASKAIIATTSQFTKPAEEFVEAHKWELEMRDLDGISEWAKECIKSMKRGFASPK